MLDPWYKSTFHYSALGSSLKLQVPHDVFSTQRIDEGTLLLLEHLASDIPTSVLDMGCGYGALGLPIAAKYKHAKVEMVDRDLMAVKWSGENADLNDLQNVDAYGSLGFRDVKQKQYDWILCNVPARIGTPFIKNFMELGNSRLSPTGDLRIVVINDLAPILKELQKESDWPMTEVAVGPRHTIFSLKKFQTQEISEIPPETLYFRDEVQVDAFTLQRPFDIGGDDQKRLKTSFPILIDALPRGKLRADQTVMCFRTFYGALPLLARKRFSEAQVVAIDRDLLGTTFTRHNANALRLGGEKLEIRESPYFPEAIRNDECFDLILGELSSSAGDAVAIDELKNIAQALHDDGQALILCLEKIEKDWVNKFANQTGTRVQRVLTREGYTVIRLTP